MPFIKKITRYVKKKYDNAIDFVINEKNEFIDNPLGFANNIVNNVVKEGNKFIDNPIDYTGDVVSDVIDEGKEFATDTINFVVDEGQSFFNDPTDYIAAGFNESVDLASSVINEGERAASKTVKNIVKEGENFFNDPCDYITDNIERATVYTAQTLNDTLQWSQEKIVRKLQQKMALDIPIEHREYLWALACEKIHYHAADQTSNIYLQEGFNFIVNTLAPMYKGELKHEQVMSQGDKPFVQSPTMLNYWAKIKANANADPENPPCKTVNLKEYTPGSNEIILAYYPPFARTFLENTSEDVYDNNNKHFYSHCKSEFICENGMKIVSNPELLYNSNSHCGNGKSANIYNPRSNDNVDEDIKGYLPEDAVTYAINCDELGLNKKDVENGFKFVSANINILDPKIQEAIFKLQDNKFTADEIVNLYVNNVDITNEENIDKLIKDKNCNIDNLAKKNNEYRYNLQEYNCAVKPVSALVFANECKIRNNEMNEHDANECRKKLGLPNIYDPERYGKLNSDFYKEYMDHLKKESDKVKDITFEQAVSSMGWGTAELFDIGLENAQNLLQKIPGVKDNAKKEQQHFNNKVTLNDIMQLLKTKEQSSQNEVNEEINYAQSINLIDMNNQNEK